MVGGGSDPKGPHSEGGEAPCITSAGFQFLLLDTPAQLWYFVLQYLRGAEVRGGGTPETPLQRPPPRNTPPPPRPLPCGPSIY